MAKRNCRIVRGSRTALSLPLVALLASVAALSACDKGKVPEPEHKPASAPKPAATAGAAGAATEKKAAKPREPLREPEFRKISAKPVATVAPAPDDPLKG